MITLITGLPGNGKTLYTLSFVKALAEKENRPVFYSGISDLALDWTEIEPEKWFEAPTGAIIVIDECQRVFRPRSLGKDVPEYVAKLETHRHQGVDLFLITQHPLLADSSIRRLVGCHKHVVRAFGTQGATIHEWGSCKDTCDKTSGRADSIKTRWKYDKDAYKYYKSAELHTVKAKIPLRLYFLILAPILLILAVFYMYSFTKKQSEKQIEKEGVSQSLQAENNFQLAMQKPSYLNAIQDAKQFIYDSTPRVEGLAYTAPRYDELTKPTRVPVPAGCIDIVKGDCTCYSQTGSRLRMHQLMCKKIIADGLFLDFDPNPNLYKKNDSLVEPKLISNR